MNKHPTADCSCFACCGDYIIQEFCQQMAGINSHNKQIYSEREIFKKLAGSAPANHTVKNVLNLQSSKYF
jgi:hypothetical protein